MTSESKKLKFFYLKKTRNPQTCRFPSDAEDLKIKIPWCISAANDHPQVLLLSQELSLPFRGFAPRYLPPNYIPPHSSALSFNCDALAINLLAAFGV